MTPAGLAFTRHDEPPRDDAARVDRGLGDANDAAAPLHEVRPMACFARDGAGEVVGGAVGRSWGACCELQQLWVDPVRRGQGIGRRLVREFEAIALARGCSVCYLETFDFQAPEFYRMLGYGVRYTHDVYPHGIRRHLMLRAL